MPCDGSAALATEAVSFSWRDSRQLQVSSWRHLTLLAGDRIVLDMKTTRLSKKETSKIAAEGIAAAKKITCSDVQGENDNVAIYWPAGFAKQLNPYAHGTAEYNVFGRAFVSFVQDTFQESVSDGWVIEGWTDSVAW